MSISRTVA